MSGQATWHAVGRALLGTWPDRVAAWGADGIDAYIDELKARGITPESALVALRSCPAEQRFPPSAAELLGVARQDPSTPTFVEAYRLIYGTRGVLRARPAETSFADDGERGRAYNRAARDRAAGFHPLITSFVDRYGIDRLRTLELDHPDYGDLKRKDLEADWNEHLEKMDGRDLASIALPRGDGLRQLDPLAALGLDRPALNTPTPEER